MKRVRSFRSFLVLVAVLFLAATTLPAATISGTFDISGTVTVTGTSSIDWTLSGVANKALVGTTSGSYAGLTGTDVSISNLTNPPDVVDGGGFANQLFISFDADPLLPNLLINYIYAGVNSPAACTASVAAGQTCTLAGSLFNFQNTAGGGSSASWVVSGVGNNIKWTGYFTSQFSTPYQTVLATLASAGAVTNTYSATFVVTATPEPATWSLALGALGVLAGCWRRKRTRA